MTNSEVLTTFSILTQAFMYIMYTATAIPTLPDPTPSVPLSPPPSTHRFRRLGLYNRAQRAPLHPIEPPSPPPKNRIFKGGDGISINNLWA